MEWFYAFNGRQAGPVSETELAELARTGVVLPETLVWKAGMGGWAAYSSVAPPPPLPDEPPPVPEEAPSSYEEMRFCSSCGNRFPVSELAFFGDSAVCAICKPAYVQRLAQGMTSTTVQRFEYAGFWIRVVAAMIDGVILSMVRYAITVPLGFEGFFSPGRPGIWYSAYWGPGPGIGFLTGIAYYVYFWTQQGATPGKMALGLKVVTPEGNLISMGQAIGRYFANYLDILTLGIGYMMAGWDDQKRALHDRLCDTRVIRTR
jgi:uncharacterized RDD family membrane protein YckC